MSTTDQIKKIQMSELESNLDLNRLLLKYISQEYATNDKAVVANLLDFSKKIILPEDKLIEIIKLAVNNPDSVVEINTNEKTKSCNCCGKCKVNVHLYADIISIMVDDRSLRTVQPFVTEFLEDKCSISLSKTYIREFIKIEKIQQPTETVVQEKNIEVSKSKDDEEKSVSDISGESSSQINDSDSDSDVPPDSSFNI